VLPHSDYNPASGLERAVDAPVACYVRFEFRSPVRAVRFWVAAVRGAAVPEASVDEYGDTLPGEDDVGPRAHVARPDSEVLTESKAKPVQL